MISDPDAFKDKIKSMERREYIDGMMKRIKSTSSFRSMYSKSQKTGITQITGDMDEDEKTLMEEMSAQDGATNTTRGLQSDPLFLKLNSFFDQVQEDIETSATTRLEFLKRTINRKFKDDQGEVNLA